MHVFTTSMPSLKSDCNNTGWAPTKSINKKLFSKNISANNTCSSEKCQCRGTTCIDEGDPEYIDYSFRYDYDIDAKVASIIAKEYSLPIFNPPLVQEGGHEVNGVGDLLVTKTSILNPNRNPGMTESEATKILWKYSEITHQ